MIATILVTAILFVGTATLYFAVHSGEFRKFLAGAFFVSAGTQFYLYRADVSLPVLGTGFVQTPELSAVRSVVHFALFLITFYFGFVSGRRPGD